MCPQDKWRGASAYVRSDDHEPPGTRRVLARFPAVEARATEILKATRTAGGALGLGEVLAVIRGTIATMRPSLLEEARFGLHFARVMVARNLGWSWRRGTTAAQKLPLDWTEKQLDMAARLASLVFEHDVPPELVLNWDQTGVWLMPTSGSCTYDQRGRKSIAITGADNKEAITAVVAVSASGAMLPLQLVFSGKTAASLPKLEIRNDVQLLGWELTQTENHWSNLASMCSYVDNIIQPYIRAVTKELQLPGDPKAVCLFDCWSVHKSREFQGELKTKHPNILPLFVPANCTSTCQPCDIAVQRIKGAL